MSEGRFVLTRIGQTLVVTLEGAADAGCLKPAAELIAEESTRHSAHSVVFEVSGCEVIDLDEFLALCKLARTIEFLGLDCVVAGLRPGTVAYLASAGISIAGLRTSLDLEHALLDLRAGEIKDEAETCDDYAEHSSEPDYTGSI